MGDIFFHGVWRMDWGLGNPNKTASLIAILMMAIWAFAYVRKWGFWPVLIAFTGLGICLIHTLSRGGIVALFAGIAVLLALAPRPWPRSRVIAIIIAAWVIIGTGIYLNAHERYSQGILTPDLSISNRIMIWKATPRMMVDAPNGWGIGNASAAFGQWYQPQDRYERYLNLINSHLTWMVEFGWLGRFGYLLGWFAVFWICFPSPKSPWLCVPLGAWIAFFTASMFSAVAESIWLWVVPGILLVMVIIFRLIRRDWPRPVTSLIPLGATVLILLGIWVIGRPGGPEIRGTGKTAIYGAGEPAYWVLYDETTMGTWWGRAVRNAYRTAPARGKAYGIALAPEALPNLKGKTLVLGSEIPHGSEATIKKAVESADHVVLLNPRFFPSEVGVGKGNKEKIKVLFGEFSAPPSEAAWQDLAPAEPLGGVGDFIPDWFSLAMDSASQTHGRQ